MPNPAAVPDACLGCAKLADPAIPTVTLLSGQEVCSWCPAWKSEALDRQLEATAVLAIPERAVRLEHLSKREAEFGAEYRRRLEAVILSTWQARRDALVATGAADA